MLCAYLCEPSFYKNLETSLDLFGVLFKKLCLFAVWKKKKTFCSKKNRKGRSWASLPSLNGLGPFLPPARERPRPAHQQPSPRPLSLFFFFPCLTVPRTPLARRSVFNIRRQSRLRHQREDDHGEPLFNTPLLPGFPSFSVAYKTPPTSSFISPSSHLSPRP